MAGSGYASVNVVVAAVITGMNSVAVRGAGGLGYLIRILVAGGKLQDGAADLTALGLSTGGRRAGRVAGRIGRNRHRYSAVLAAVLLKHSEVEHRDGLKRQNFPHAALKMLGRR